MTKPLKLHSRQTQTATQTSEWPRSFVASLWMIWPGGSKRRSPYKPTNQALRMCSRVQGLAAVETQGLP